MSTWVTDVPEDEVAEALGNLNAHGSMSAMITEAGMALKAYMDRNNAKYEHGSSHNGEEGMVGIYFNDPTATSSDTPAVAL